MALFDLNAIDLNAILLAITVFFWMLSGFAVLALVAYKLIVHMILYPYRFGARPVYGDIKLENGRIVVGQGGRITFGKYRVFRIAPCKGNSEWKILWSKKRIPPIPTDAILPGKQIDGYKLPDGTLVSTVHVLRDQGEKIEMFMNAILPEAKSHAINELEAYAKKYDPRTQSDKIKMIGGWVLAGIVMFGLLVSGAYFGYSAFKYGVNAGQTAAIQGQEVCGQKIADAIAVKFGLSGNNASVVKQPNSPLPLNLFGGG